MYLFKKCFKIQDKEESDKRLLASKEETKGVKQNKEEEGWVPIKENKREKMELDSVHKHCEKEGMRVKIAQPLCPFMTDLP